MPKGNKTAVRTAGTNTGWWMVSGVLLSVVILVGTYLSFSRAEESNVLASCGNGTVEVGEMCDDGNAVDHDFCSNACEMRDSSTGQGTVRWLGYTVSASPAASVNVYGDEGLLSINLEGDGGETALTVSGLQPGKEYHYYQESYENHTAITADADGSVALPASVSGSAYVWLQDRKSTKFISSTGCIAPWGSWDATTKTCTLLQDLAESVSISGITGLTLDCDGHKITGLGAGVGVSVSTTAPSTTVKDCDISSFTNGMTFTNANANVITGNIIHGLSSTTSRGIQMTGTGQNSLIKQNSFYAINGIAINLLGNRTTVEGNDITLSATTASARGISVDRGTLHVLKDNVISGTGIGYGIAFVGGTTASTYATVTNNSVTSARYGLAYLSTAPFTGTSFAGNSFVNNADYGIYSGWLTTSSTYAQTVACGNGLDIDESSALSQWTDTTCYDIANYAGNTTLACDHPCTAGPVCGNGSVEAGEQCDDGNTSPYDGCSATCQIEVAVCGNGAVEFGEQCDDGNVTPVDGCSASCQIEVPVCGNGAVEFGEQCDDGNVTPVDGCSASCQIEDIQAPTFTVNQPTSLITKNASRTLSGSYADGPSPGATGMQSIFLTVNGGTPISIMLPGGIGSTSGTFSYSVTLAEGPNVLLLTFTDRAGNVSSSTAYTFTRDSQLPTVSVNQIQGYAFTTVNGEFVTNVQSQVLTGTASDPSPSSGINSLTINGAAVAVGADGTFSYPVNLNSGGNTFDFVVEDLAGNKQTITQTYLLDTVAPTITIKDGAYYNHSFKTLNPAYCIQGTAGDSTGLDRVEVNGTNAPLGAPVYLGQEFELCITLAEGLNEFDAIAYDRVGNTASQAFTVLLDSVPPTIVFDPISIVATNDENLQVSGRLTDAAPSSGVSGVTLVNVYSGQQYFKNVLTAADGSFSGVVTLKPGINVIRIRASDGTGNQTEVLVEDKIILDLDPIELTNNPLMCLP